MTLTFLKFAHRLVLHSNNVLMRLPRRCRVLLLLSMFLLVVLYSNFRKEAISQVKEPPKHAAVRQTEDRRLVQTQIPTKVPSPVLTPPSVNVSSEFRTSIPENGAYWNQLLHARLKRAERGENPLSRDPSWPHCRDNQTNVNDVASYSPLLRNFLWGMKCRSPPFLMDQPDKCKENATFLLFAIKSIPAHFERRQAVRDTWGREYLHDGGLHVRTAFLLGASSPDDPDISALVRFEAERYGDILQADFHDSLLNLTLKMNAFLRWTLERCPRVSFVFSGDDDVIVNTPALLSYLSSLDSSKASRLYTGHVIKTARPLRDPKSKYFIPASFYKGPYPAYAGGGGFVISGALLRPLYSACGAIPFFPIDDVYIGMCFNALGVSPQAHGGFHTFDIRERDRENLCIYKNLILVHRRSPQQVKKIWRGIHSPLLTC
ncbi:N-acetyllactosaminide beta-1,3-N-acetylglucosaminyltransferase 2 isoform 1-T1 [Syngnathus typhle]